MKNPNLHALNSRRLAAVGTSEFRALHVAWCLLRGRTIEQIESANSNPHQFLGPTQVANLCCDGYRPFDPLFYGVKTLQEYEAEKAAFHKKVVEDLTSWHKRLHLTWMESEGNRRKRNALKRSTPRLHPRPRPVDLPSRVA